MISAILLAAGESRRMGDLKQLLPFGKNTIIESCIDNLTASRIGELIVVVGHRAEEVMERIKERNLKIVINEAYRDGMTRSIQAGLSRVAPDSKAIMIALVDQPSIPPNIINLLIDAYNQSKAAIVKPRYENCSGHPVIIDISCKDEILSLGADEGLNKVTRARASETIYVDVDCPQVVEDIDTPEDYERYGGRRTTDGGRE